MMKKRTLTISLCLAAVLVCVLAIGLVCFRARPVVPTPYTLVSASDGISSDRDIYITSVYFEDENRTDQFDAAALASLLNRYSCRLSMFTPSGQYPVEGTWEINLIQGGKPLHVVVGNSPFCYTDSSLRYKIVNSGSLWQEISALQTA